MQRSVFGASFRAWTGAAAALCGVTQALAAAVPGIASVSGHVVGIDGTGLSGIRIGDETQSVYTNASGEFYLPYVPLGSSVLRVDGRNGGINRDINYGIYEILIDVKPDIPLTLPYKIWLTPIDQRSFVRIPSPTTAQVVARASDMPDLELYIPKGIVIRDIDGNVVTHISITRLQSDKTPFPFAGRWTAPVAFTLQPGGACLYNNDGRIGSAQIFYPNVHHDLPGARSNVWRYEPGGAGWRPYGVGVVSANGRQIIPEAQAVIHDFGSAECDPAKRSAPAAPRPLPRERITP